MYFEYLAQLNKKLLPGVINFEDLNSKTSAFIKYVDHDGLPLRDKGTDGIAEPVGDLG
ncbi:hypothetical protein [Desulfosporosinus sp.]|uniref:hypothetical protein n=1 Tax=Desulfosporosinus sp. TaxID=157907 RepID=UPI0023140EC7|nr:hypothetical protein [Desulfosporosinus sp.]MDA8223175.1 hypothetical protein [Desulfitobacterium hafniense]